jgi:hypothetical protein
MSASFLEDLELEELGLYFTEPDVAALEHLGVTNPLEAVSLTSRFPLAGLGLTSAGILALTSIALSANQISKHEKKNSRKHQLSLFEAYPDMAGTKRKSGGGSEAPAKRPKPGSNGPGTMVPVPRAPRAGPVAAAPSIITRAPVAIGNTIRGIQTVERVTKLGKQCIGRDFMFTPVAPGAVANWTMVGGCPLSPTAFADSNLRQYAQMYNKFRFLGFTAHFITSSPTSTNGDVMFYYNKNRESPFINQTSANLLPFVMSDPNAVLGPQWQNISATFDVDSEWKSLDYGIDDAPKEYSAGELFLLCKTSNTESPGYVLFDYIIEFGERSIQPRLLTLPITRELYNQMGVATPSGSVVINTPYGLRASGLNISGTTSSYPPGILDGDIYKVVVDRTNSTLGAGSTNITSSLYGHEVAGSTGAITMSDGFTCYAVYNLNTDAFYFYLNAASAYAGSTNRIFWASNTGTVSITLQIWLSYVGSTNFSISNVSNF